MSFGFYLLKNKRFLKPLQIFLQPGDFVEYQSPILTFFSPFAFAKAKDVQIKRQIDSLYSIPFQQTLLLYRMHARYNSLF